jgi:endonuclease III
MEKKKSIGSKDLNIDLSSRKEAEVFRWFLACLLFGKPIQQEVARRTYDTFVAEGLDNPDAIIKAGWDKLVEVLDKGHYVRYDYSTATKLLDVCKALKEKYRSLGNLIEHSENQADLARKLEEFKGVGPVTVGIFLRDLLPLYEPFQETKNT